MNAHFETLVYPFAHFENAVTEEKIQDDDYRNILTPTKQALQNQQETMA